MHLKFKATKALRRVINIYQSSENLKLLITEENNSDYLIIVQGYAGIYWILASMRILICHLPPLHNSSDLPSNAKTAQEQLKEPSKETRMFNQNSKSTYLNWIEHPLDYPYLTMLYLWNHRIQMICCQRLGSPPPVHVLTDHTRWDLGKIKQVVF